MAEDIDFKYPMREACAWEINKFCKDVPHGHARVIRCLQVCMAPLPAGTSCLPALLACWHLQCASC
jgi:Golgi apparatus protein 1